MKYCFDYISGGDYLHADELVFKYTENNPNLIKKMESMEDKYRIIIDICGFSGDVDYDVINQAMKVHPNSALRLFLFQYEEMKLDKGNKYFFAVHCSSYETLEQCIKCGVSDVYITDDLCFDIPNVCKVCKKNNVSIRVYPNVAQGTDPKENSFFIRPEDAEMYETYVDVFEFYGASDRQETLYKIYSRGSWNGKLNQIMTNIPFDIDNYYIPTIFGATRFNCQKKCYYSDCKICSNSIELANAIRKRLNEEENLN